MEIVEKLNLHEILNATGGRLKENICLPSDVVVKSISTDTRTLKKGDLFIALLGKNFDGHDFVDEAFKKGACGAIVNKKAVYKCSLELEKNKFIIVVDDTVLSLGRIANYYLSKFSTKVVGITGSCGKTTTKEMISEFLSIKFNVLKSKENFNNEIGVPLTIFNLNRNHQIIVLEMAARSNINDIKYLCSIAQPDVSVITNIGVSHIELLHSKENIFKAKSEIIYNLKKNGVGVLNYDDRYLKRLLNLKNKKLVTFGLTCKADVFAKNIEINPDGFNFILKVNKENLEKKVFLPLLGYHNIYNLLSAICVGRIFEVDIDKMIEKIAIFKNLSQRGEVIYLKGIKILSDFYNASPPSVKNALWVLKNQIKSKRKIAVFGDMKELGKISSLEHRKIGREVAKNGIDILITIGDKSRYIFEEGKKNTKAAFHFEKNKDAAEKLLRLVRPDDAILIKGSRSTRLEEIFEFLKNNV